MDVPWAKRKWSPWNIKGKFDYLIKIHKLTSSKHDIHKTIDMILKQNYTHKKHSHS